MAKITGTESPETLDGTGANDEINAGAGDDTVYGLGGDDVLRGEQGDDLLFGDDGNDELFGGAGEDALVGGPGDDILKGGAGFDVMEGDAGDDTFLVTDLYDHIHDSSGNDRAIVSVSFAKIPSEIEQVEYVDGAMPLPYWISALIANDSSGSYYSWALGEEKTFWYAFPERVPAYAAARHSQGYRQLTPAQQANALIALEYLESIIDVEVKKIGNPDQPNTIAIALRDLGDDSGGVAFHPTSQSWGSDIYINDRDYNGTLGAGTFGAFLLMHELGHALGLKHPFDEPDAGDDVAAPPYLQGSEDDTRWTMMSYNESRSDYKLYFSELDIAALQYLYGPSPKARADDNIYRITANAPNFIWDGGGVDAIDASGSPRPVTIFLAPGYWGHVGDEGPAAKITAPGQITVNFGTEIENLIGSAYSDALTGNSLDNSIRGGAGDDTIDGKEGDDILTGGPGADEFIVSSGVDSIGDFESGIDRLYVHIDTVAKISFSSPNLDLSTDLVSNAGGIEIQVTEFSGQRIIGSPSIDYLRISDGGADFSGSLAGESFLLRGADGQISLNSVERIIFQDQHKAIDLAGNAGVAAKVLGAFLGPDGLGNAGLVGYVLNLLDNGASYGELLQTAIDTVFGTDPQGADLVRHFHKILTGTPAPEEIVSTFGAMLDNGETTPAELAMLAAEHELNLANIDFVGLAQSGLDYLPA